MDRPFEKEKSTRKTRDERGRDRDAMKDHRDGDRHRDRDHKHRSREDEDYHHSDKHRSSRDDKHRDGDHHHHHRSDRESKRERSHEPRHDRESSKDRDRVHDRESKRERSHEPRIDREGSRDRDSAYGRESKRERSHELRSEREGSRDPELRHDRSYEARNEREGSRDGFYNREVKREQSYEARSDREGSRDRVREESVERSRSHKRKERGGSRDRYDGGEKRVRVSDGAKEDRKDRRRFEDGKDLNGVEREERRERKIFEDGVKDNEVKDVNKSSMEGRRERRKFGDRVKEEEDLGGVEDGKQVFSPEITVKKEPVDGQVDNAQGSATSNGSGSVGNGAALEPIYMASRSVPETTLAPSHPLPIKVSSISTTNENKGVSITRSHEVPGKSSTDGTSSAAGKSGSLSLDALAKAKKALQMQKELAEKMKKIPMLNKVAGSSSDGSQQVGSREGVKAPHSSTGILHGPGQSTVPAGAIPSASTLPAAASAKPPAGGMAALAGLTAVPNLEAVKRAQELAAKMGFRQDPDFSTLINLFPGQVATEAAVQQKPSKAPVLRLDALGREIDEHGNVVNLTKPNNLSTLKVNINKQKKEAFQILKPELDVDPESNPHFDGSMGINKSKLLRPKRMTFQFVEEGKWSKDAEIIKLKSQFGEAQAKELKAKQAQLAKAKAEPDINPNLIEVSERVIIKEKPKDPIPETEWWDVPLLQSGTYGDIAEGDIAEDKLKMDKITIYTEHPRPIEPPAEPAPPPPQPLKLTKKEQKKLRTQRRLAREKDRQEMIRQGLIEPPKPKVKMSNLMKVLGSEATQDPTRLEMEIRSAAAEREQAHVDRNIARKLTPAERREKKERKLFDDPNTVETIVSVYKINDLSHPQTRFKVDVNAQENRLSGCAVISDGISVVVVEGGSKSIKRYGKLMLRRINWASAVENQDEDGDENEEKPINKCVLVWQGSVAKPSFNRFFVHDCRTEAAARKVFSDAGVAHYWDLSVNFSDDQI